MGRKPLAGIRALDLSQFLPGPFAAQMLADLGADVVKIEPPAGDPMRYLNPVTNARGDAPFHAAVNSGKRIVRVDLKSAGGKEAMAGLVAASDVLLESYRPGVLERLGFGFEAAREINPGLVYCSLSGFGQTGPQRLWAGHDINYVAMTGALNMTGPEEGPQPAFPPIADYGGALQAVIAIQAAIIGRANSGEGAHVDVAMAEAVLAWQAYGMVQAGLAASGGAAPPTRGRDLLTGGAACYRVYETADGGFVSLGAIEEVFWANFCESVGRPDWRDRQMEEMPQTSLIEEVSEMFRSRDRAHWERVLVRADCCFHPVLAYDEVADWPQVADRQLVDRDAAGGFQGIRLPVWWNGAPPDERAKALEVSVDEVLSEWNRRFGGAN